jgi:hypothetical protein
VHWRLRRATSIESGLFQIQGEFVRQQRATMQPRRRAVPPPQWHDDLDGVQTIDATAVVPCQADESAEPPFNPSEALADCYLQVSRLGYGAFDLLHRYEAAQILIMLQTAHRR